MSASPFADETDEFTAAAQQALAISPGSSMLDTLGWWDLLADLDDAEARAAVFALFRAQGRVLADTAAIGGLLALPYARLLTIDPGRLVCAISRPSPRRGPVYLVFGDVASRSIAVDRPGQGVAVIPAETAALRPIRIPGRMTVHEVTVTAARADRAPAIPAVGAEAEAARSESLRWGRLAAALEIVGGAEAAVTLAVEHARNRQQFGQPIGSFQAVRHLLAWATTDCTAVARVCAEGVRLGAAMPLRWPETAKALAGRNGRRACERAMQVLGGIGFTAEHTHHEFHSRVLALDAVLGSSAELTRALGAAARTDPDSLPDPEALIVDSGNR